MKGLLALALGYPYGAPADSYTLRGDEVAGFSLDHVDGRTPVLAYGSNRAPDQLKRKFGRVDTLLPVQRAWLADHDVVYSAHFAAYGSLPAALRPMVGCRVAVAVTWLDGEQLEVMHATEVGAQNYSYGALDLSVATAGGGVLDEVFGYAGTRGHLARDGEAVALAEIDAVGRRLTAVGQREAQALARDMLAPDLGLEDFIAGNVGDDDLRRRRIAALNESAV